MRFHHSVFVTKYPVAFALESEDPYLLLANSASSHTKL